MIEDPKEWIAISQLQGIGPATLLKLFENGWCLSRLIDDFEQSPLCKQPHSYLLLSDFSRQRGSLWESTCLIENKLRALQARSILASDADYPPLLKEAPDRPVILFVKGNLDALHLPIISIVGSRNASTAGLRHAYQFSKALSDSGVVVVSGLASGIDGAAHQAAVDSGKPTVAVMGTGSDQIYPSRHRQLAEAILKNGGALVTDLLPGSGPLAHHFPRRNRIISGLSTGVLVVEAAIKSGSLITARNALNQGREVFSIPGPIDHPGSKGCHALIREGATLVESVDQILTEISPLLGHLEYEQHDSIQDSEPSLDDEHKALLRCIEFTLTYFEDIQQSWGGSEQQLQASLMELEWLGWIEPLVGGYQRIK